MTTSTPVGKDANMENYKLPTGTYNYSGVKVADLGAAEFTLVTLVNDISSSVETYANDMSDASAKVVESCSDQRNPRRDNLLLRSVHFNQRLTEVHGFKPVVDCTPTDYASSGNLSLKPSGMTALFDAARNAILATNDYGKQLTEQDYKVNGIVFVMTDGFDNSSIIRADEVAAVIKKVQKDESLESLITILIGVGVDDNDDTALQAFMNEAGLTQYIKLEDASPESLAKLANFVSRSISSQSQALGTGGPSQPLAL